MDASATADTSTTGGASTGAATAEGTEAGNERGVFSALGPNSCAFTGFMSGSQEVPGPADPDGTGSSVIAIDRDSNQLCYTIYVEGITLPAAAAHIHRAPLGRAGDVVVPLTAPDEDGYASGCVAVDKTLAGQILANPANFYVNVHTSDFPNGAVRGQLFGSTRLTGAEEVPGPGDPDGFGAATILFDTAKNQVCWAITVEDVTLPATAAHIHKAKIGQAGDVVVPLSAPDEDGVALGCATADPALVRDIQANPQNYYVNVHTSDFPNGALRGQLFGSTRLTGAEEVPGPGDPDGFGAATILFDTARIRFAGPSR